MRNVISVTGTGDALFTARFPEEYLNKIKGIADFIQSCDVRLTNLETNLSDFDIFAGAYSGGTWLNTRCDYFEDLMKFGFNFYGTANNHAMDYSFQGLLSTLNVLDKYKVAHAGTGRSLEEATKPAILNINGKKIAIFAVDASALQASFAGLATKEIPARPGVNYLRNEKIYSVSEEEMNQLRSIAKKTHINFTRQLDMDTGYILPDPEGYFVFGDRQFTTKENVPSSMCNIKDKKRLLESIQIAKNECELIFMLVHCHDDNGLDRAQPPAYLREYCHDCIDAGVSAVFGGGCHSLRPIEIYNGNPIFYSLGDFIYQGLTVEYLPADFMNKYGIDIYSSAKEALWVRSRGGKVGLHKQKKNYQTVLPKIVFEAGVMVDLCLLPVYLNFDRNDEMNGLPEIAIGQEREEIFHILSNLCKGEGIKLKMENGLIVLEK